MQSAICMNDKRDALAVGRELHVDCCTLRLAAQSWGSSGDTPILAIHGWLDNSASFAPLARLVHNFYMLAPDLPGHGKSAHLPAIAPYSLETYALTMIEVVNQLGWDRFSIVGHSLGANIGALVAASRPKRVDRLVMLDALGAIRLSGAHSMVNLLDSMGLGREALHQPEVRYPSMSAAVHVRRVLSSLPVAVAQSICERDVIAKDDGVSFACGFDRRLLPSPNLPFTEEQTQALLAAIHCPTLLIRGSNGHLHNEEIEDRKACVSSLIEVTIAGDHHFHAQYPEKTWELILKFLRSATNDLLSTRGMSGVLGSF